MSGYKQNDEAKDDAQPLENAVRERLSASRTLSEQKTFVQLARSLSKLPAERARAALEIGAASASINWRLGVEFLRAAPEAALVLDAETLRQWSEIGKRLSVTDIERGAEFYARGVRDLCNVPERVRPMVFEVSARQMRLSANIAAETIHGAGEIARAAQKFDAEIFEAWLAGVYEIALEISRRSAKHSADFLQATVETSNCVGNTENNQAEVARGVIELARLFAINAGGIAADLWASVPAAFEKLDAAARLKIVACAERFLERGGAAALSVFTASSIVLRSTPSAFDDWLRLAEIIAASGNAGLVTFARLTPAFFDGLARSNVDANRRAEIAARALNMIKEVAGTDTESALNCFRSARAALAQSSIDNFERWAREGLSNENLSVANATTEARARRSYYALETRASHEKLQSGNSGLALSEVAHILQLYVEALTARAVEVAPLSAIPNESRICDGRTIHLPHAVAEFDSDEMNFRLYKVLAAHAAGQIEFGTHECVSATNSLEAAYTSIAELYADENVAALDAFSLSGYIEEVVQGERALSEDEERKRLGKARKRMPADADFRALLRLFPQQGLAARIFGTLENGRIDCRLRHAYKGLRRDLDFVQARLAKHCPNIALLPVTLVPFELLFQITLCGGATDDARAAYAQIVSELEGIVADYLTDANASVADTLMATSRVYALFQSISPDDSQHQQTSNEDGLENDADESEGQDASAANDDENMRDGAAHAEKQTAPPDARELFNQWANASANEFEMLDTFDAGERWTQTSAPEQPLEAGDTAHAYDEWDRDLGDYRVAWCRVIEKRVKRGDRNFVELARSRHRGLISSLRYQFQLMRPEGLRRVHNELDGDDYNLESVIDYVVDRRAASKSRISVQPSERLYTKRLRRERDVAVAFLLDQSSSTARTIGRHPMQPYTHPGRRIIEIEKEGLVLMSEALESVGDAYAIYGFTSEGRRNVRFYVVKDFDEHLTPEVEARIGGINFQHNTRLGAAIRHASARLAAREARTHLLIVLTDGRPYDHDYGDSMYAREDTREALKQSRASGITPFCITIDRDGEQELRDLYGEVGYTIIDDVLSLPERLPMIYRRLTT